MTIIEMDYTNARQYIEQQLTLEMSKMSIPLEQHTNSLERSQLHCTYSQHQGPYMNAELKEAVDNFFIGEQDEDACPWRHRILVRCRDIIEQCWKEDICVHNPEYGTRIIQICYEMIGRNEDTSWWYHDVDDHATWIYSNDPIASLVRSFLNNALQFAPREGLLSQLNSHILSMYK